MEGVLKSMFLLYILTIFGLSFVKGQDNVSPNSLYEGHTISDFLKSCTAASTEICQLNSPSDFRRLDEAKLHIQGQVEFQRDILRIIVRLIFSGVITILMIYLVLVGHYDPRTLPLIRLMFDDTDKDKGRGGIKYKQYLWMKYLVLKGNNPSFRKRIFGDIKWYKYKRQDIDSFDFKHVPLIGWQFLTKKALEKHMEYETELEKDKDAEQGDPQHSHAQPDATI